MALRISNPRQDSVEKPSKPSKPSKPASKPMPTNKGGSTQMWDRKADGAKAKAASKAAPKPMIGGRPAPRAGDDFKSRASEAYGKGTDRFKMTPAEKQKTVPKPKISFSDAVKSVNEGRKKRAQATPPMIGGVPSPDGTYGKQPAKTTPAEKPKKGPGSMTKPAPRVGAAASGNAKSSGGAGKGTRR